MLSNRSKMHAKNKLWCLSEIASSQSNMKIVILTKSFYRFDLSKCSSVIKSRKKNAHRHADGNVFGFKQEIPMPYFPEMDRRHLDKVMRL